MVLSPAEKHASVLGAPRQVRPGIYHYTDLLRKQGETIAKWHVGKEAPTGIDGYLAERGNRSEDACLNAMGVPDGVRDPEVNLDLDNGAVVTGHPEYVAICVVIEPVDGDPFERIIHPESAPPDLLDEYEWWWEVGEAKSDLHDDDPDKRTDALDQGLGYTDLIHKGAEVTLGDGTVLDPDLDAEWRVRPILGGLYDIGDRKHYPADQDVREDIGDYVVEKSRHVHESIESGDLSIVAAFDGQHTVFGSNSDGWTPTPVAEGELGGVCDRIVAASMLKSYAEDVYDEERARYQATAEEWFEDADAPSWEAFRDSCKRYAPRLGGTVNVVCETVTETQESDKLDQYRDALEGLEAEWEEIQEDALADLRAEHADLLESIQDQRKEVERLEEQLTVERKEPSYARAWKPGDKTVQDALNVLFDEGGDGSGS